MGVIELELMKLVRHLETFGRRSSLYRRVDRAGYLALRTLDAGGPISVNALAHELRLDASTVTRQVTALERAGFVRRRSDPTDRRSGTIVLSAEGRRTMRGVEEERRRVIEELLEGWKEGEVADLGRMVAKLNRSLFASVADRSPRRGAPAG
ncbi:MAG TPA: MarR family transcriptional regulator [Acidimicrobiales bacterium]